MKKQESYNPDNCSPLTQLIYNAYEHHRKCGHSALFIFWEIWPNHLSFCGVPARHYPWAVYDSFKQHAADAQLCMAFNLHMPFEEQFPLSRFRQMETLTAFAATPLVWINDRQGNVPARLNEEFYKNALRPRFNIINNAYRNAETSPEKRAQKRPSFNIIKK